MVPMASGETTTAIEDLVELPSYAPPAAYRDRKATERRPAAKRATLLDRLVSTARVDRVTVDLAALEADLDALRRD